MVTTHRNDTTTTGSSAPTPTARSARSGKRRSFFDRVRRRPAPSDFGPGNTIDRSAGTTSAVAHTPPVVELDDESFSAALHQAVTIVDFWAPWCGPCKQLHPLFDARAAEYASDALKFARVNVDENPAIAAAHNIMSIPTIIVFDGDGNEVEREIGLPGKRRLDQLVRAAGSRARKTSGKVGGTVAGEATGQGVS